MSLPERPPFRIFSPTTRHARSHSALPKSRDNLSWDDAVSVIERSQLQSQSYFHGKISSVQRKIQAFHPSSRSGEHHAGLCERRSGREACGRASSESRTLEQRNPRQSSDRRYRDTWAPTPPNSDQGTEREYIGAQIANCLPPSHLDGPPPPYLSGQSIIQIDFESTLTLHPLVRKSTDNLFFEPLGLGLQIPDPRLHQRSHSADARLTQLAPTETPSVFELEHWAGMEQSYEYVKDRIREWARWHTFINKNIP